MPQPRLPHTRRAGSRRFLESSAHAIAPVDGSDALTRALLAALRLRRPQLLQHLLDEAGAAAFARALSACSPRQVADALSLLPPVQRRAVVHALPAPERQRWQAALAPAAAASSVRLKTPGPKAPGGSHGWWSAVRGWRWSSGAGAAPA